MLGRFHHTMSGVLLAMMLAAAPVAAQDDPPGFPPGDRPFDVTADSVDYERDRDVYVARGDVRITQEGRVLTADWVAFSNTSGVGLATGNVIVHEGNDVLHADVLHFEVDELKGIVLGGRLEGGDNDFLVESARMRKVGDQDYELEDATFTTCRCPEGERLPWQIAASEADLEIGGYATVRNTTFDVLGVPVMWLPWMKYPIKEDRETGLLFPTFGQSARTGFSVGLPFFWAAHDRVNVTLTPNWTADNGLKGDAEIEYVFGKESEGRFFASFLPDDDSIDSADPSTPFDSERWAFEWEAVHELPEFLPGRYWRHKVDARVVSDNLYTFDFNDFRGYRADRYLESKTFVEGRFGPFERYGLSAEVLYADDVANPDDADRDRFLLQRAPDIRVSGAPQPLGWFRSHVSFDTRYTHFTRFHEPEDRYGTGREVGRLFFDTGIDGLPDGFERDSTGAVVVGDGSLDDFPGPEGDFRFQEGELLSETGHRLVINPRVHAPFRLFDLVEVLPELGYHGTFYQGDDLGSESRHLLTGLVDVRTRLRKDVTLPGGVPGVHVLEPRLVYTGVLREDQNDSPLFITRPAVIQERIRQLDPVSVVRDPSDRIRSVNALTLALGQRFYRNPRQDQAVAPRLWGDLTASAQYDFANDDIRNVYLDGTLYPFDHWEVRFNSGWDLDESEISEALLEAAYSDEKGNDFQLSYRLVKQVPQFFENFRFDRERFDEFDQAFDEIQQVNLQLRWAFAPRWAVTYHGAFSIEQSLLLRNEIGLEYVSKCQCWAIRLEVEDDRTRGIDFALRYRLIGLGDDTVRPFSGRSRTRRSDDLVAPSEES